MLVNVSYMQPCHEWRAHDLADDGVGQICVWLFRWMRAETVAYLAPSREGD